MTTDRELLQQAFDALNDALVYLPPNIHAENVALFAVNSLRARLAQPEQNPVSEWDNERIKEFARQAQQYAECATPQGLEWLPTFKEKFAEAIIKECADIGVKQKPLTDEQIRKIGLELGLKCKLGGNTMIDFDYARAIEAAHGIKETK